jgi:hypothetical protein
VVRASWCCLGVAWVALGLGGCSRAVGKGLNPAAGDGSVATEAGQGKGGGLFGNADPSLQSKSDAALFAKDAEVTADGFFVNDPAPPMCGQDGQMQSAQTPGGTPDCPSDKNREGCPCSQKDMTASCWPGKRVNRNHGICKDGTTQCQPTLEFGLRWGACHDYVLPQPDAVAGPAACGCFSSGTWKLNNLAPCIQRGTATYLYSSKLTTAGTIDCGVGSSSGQPPVPSGNWTEDTLNVDCGGQFKLCFTIKAGDVNNPKPDDCAITQSCLDVWYPQAGVDQKLPDLPAWSSNESACAAKFDQSGGYGEMSVIGKSIECDAVDDGMGHPYVFYRTDYCPPTQDCSVGGSGMFGK